MAFDPDAYLSDAAGGGVAAPGFDPDAYLAGAQFDPDQYLGIQTEAGNAFLGEAAPIVPGNIDLWNRPRVKNADGSISTVRSISFTQDGKEILIPTVAADGSGILPEAAAIDQFKKTGQHLGIFETPAEATAFAEQLHKDQAAQFDPNEPQTAADLMSSRFTHEQIRRALKSGRIKIPTMSEVGFVPKEIFQGGLRITPAGLALTAAEQIAPDALPTKIAEGVEAGVSETLAGFTTPENLSTLAAMPASKIAQVLINLGFGAEAIANVPAEIKAYGAAKDPQEKAKIVTGLVASLGLPALGVTHAALRKPEIPNPKSQIPSAGEIKSFEQSPNDLAPADSQPSTLNPQPSLVPFMEDASIPFMTKVRWKDHLLERGMTDAEIDSVTSSAAAMMMEETRSSQPGTRPGRTASDAEAAEVQSQPGLRIPSEPRVATFESPLGPSLEEPPPGMAMNEPSIRRPNLSPQDQTSEVPRPESRASSQPKTTASFERGKIVDHLPSGKGVEFLTDWGDGTSTVRTADGVIKRVKTNDLKSPTRKSKIENRKSAAEIAAEAEYRASLIEDARASQAAQGPELLEAIADAGGLPSANARMRAPWAGELARLDEMVRDPQRVEKLSPNKLFRADAPDVDELATRLRDQGFDVDTPTALIDLAEQRLRTSKPIYGTPAREAALWHEQNAVPFGFGPGAAASGENLQAGSQIAQLTNTVTSALRTERPAPMTERFKRTIEAAGGAVISGRERLASAGDTARAAWLTLKNGFLRPPVEGEFRDAVKDWQGTDQRASFEVRQFVHKVRAELRDPVTREAITNYIQADGDINLLRQRAAASNVKYRPGYERALYLDDAQRNLAANARQYFDAMLQDGINAGILDHGLENYITQVWRAPNRITRELQASLQSGKLQTSFQFARKRIFDSFFEGEQAGYVPASKDVSALIAAYDLSFNKALAARGFVKALRESKAPDGDAVVKFSGMTQPIINGSEIPEAYLIRSRAVPETAVTKDGRKYEPVNHPALSGWKLAVQNEISTVPAFYQTDMLVHPDYAPQLRNMLGTSAFRVGKMAAVTAPLLKLGAFAKQTKLSLSAFHLVQEGLHSLFHRVNPANIERINFEDPKQWALVRGGLQIADYSAMELFAEGLRGGGLVSKIPVLGRLQNNFNEFLFKDYIPRLKMTMALHAFDRNVARYPKLSKDQVAELTAAQGNAAFGELNYKLMARNPGVQDFLRLTLLAPDFLEARGRFVGQALKAYGAEQRTALLLGGAVIYVTARALNQWLDDDPHWNKPFSVFYKGREYRLRTVMGDVQEMIVDPQRFWYNRFSPWIKQGMTLATGRDYRGIKLDNQEQVMDALSWMIPIPFGRQDNATIPQRILGSAALSNKPAPTAIDEAFEFARDYKKSLPDPKIRAEVRRANQETYATSDYRDLSRALIDHDNERAVNEIVRLMREQGKSQETMEKYFDNLPDRPFTGSMELEDAMLPKLNPYQRKRYREAVQLRQQMLRRFSALMPYALAALRAK